MGKDAGKVRLSSAMHKALVSARDRGTPTAHLSGMSDWGGWGATRQALQRRGYLDVACRITDAGRSALSAGKDET
jgi:hypothetical protein